MALLTAVRGAQNVQVAEFIFNYTDEGVDANDGETKAFGVVDDVFQCEIFKMPVGAIICGGELLVETEFAGAAASICSLGIDGDEALLFANVDLTAQARTELTLSTDAPYAALTGENLHLTVYHTTTPVTAGKARVRVMYTITGRIEVSAPA